MSGTLEIKQEAEASAMEAAADAVESAAEAVKEAAEAVEVTEDEGVDELWLESRFASIESSLTEVKAGQASLSEMMRSLLDRTEALNRTAEALLILIPPAEAIAEATEAEAAEATEPEAASAESAGDRQEAETSEVPNRARRGRLF